ncbi:MULTISPECIES: polysaccharide deacetylase family protein [unclassified Streptomyces]|uniref:polysaccharide deacetylase family protein n=1 Tax=unclassified Streptomyces TaxID=2593676 RepID=UPI0033BC708E
MRPVRQNDGNRTERTLFCGAALRGAATAGRALRGVRGGLLVLTAAVLAAGCADAGSGVRPASGQQPLNAPPARALDAYASKLRAAHAARVAAAKRWGLARTPLTAPPAPEKKPVIGTRKGFEVDGQDELPPVFTTVPTKDKVVFLTIDDGAEKDPAFLRMTSELKIPYTAFLSHYLAKEDYGYFRRMQAGGVGLNNHTLHHPYLPNLSYKQQKREICGMQDTMEKQFGKRPTLFRPPYGNYNEDTLRAARSCGIKAAPLWNEEVFPDHWDYREWDRSLHPGDIVLTHFRGREDWKGTMPDMLRRFLKKVTHEGYAVARLEDYL